MSERSFDGVLASSKLASFGNIIANTATLSSTNTVNGNLIATGDITVSGELYQYGRFARGYYMSGTQSIPVTDSTPIIYDTVDNNFWNNNSSTWITASGGMYYNTSGMNLTVLATWTVPWTGRNPDSSYYGTFLVVNDTVGTSERFWQMMPGSYNDFLHQTAAGMFTLVPNGSFYIACRTNLAGSISTVAGDVPRLRFVIL